MKRFTGRAGRTAAVAIGALVLGAVFVGTASASPLGGLGGGDDSGNGNGGGYSSGSNHGYGSGVGNFANGNSGYDDNGGYSTNGYRSAFGSHGSPGIHNGIVGADVPDVETK